jgi:hypothetical protein
MKNGVRGIYEFFMSREPADLALLAALIVGWLGFLLFVRWVYHAMRRRDAQL